MAASGSLLGAATRFKLGGSATEQITNRFKLNGPGVDDSLGAQHPSLYWMAAPNIDSDATIRPSFAGSSKVHAIKHGSHFRSAKTSQAFVTPSSTVARGWLEIKTSPDLILKRGRDFSEGLRNPTPFLQDEYMSPVIFIRKPTGIHRHANAGTAARIRELRHCFRDSGVTPDAVERRGTTTCSHGDARGGVSTTHSRGFKNNKSGQVIAPV
ncbi:hypothetical protein PSTT_13664 [Puccinia striiformis]|uniref:Uncharacterized protein n=2 Tax=Puccinia striiformis TaxID=27350 RepID=A0A0L0V596_9BASI|nr:hypothetical protein PSTG_12241 [Puccinia striiformis f. sp. tritici PST-78]POV99651.1 hypothetical protein PSTT_13664 [Puccinia striiformis]